MTPDTSGPAWRTPLAYYDPDSSCWKTSGAIFPSDWPTSSETCPPWGMTRGGELFELPTSVPPTGEPASSSSPSLLPTPVADHSRGLPQPGTDFASLPNVAISLLPTPAVNDMGAAYTPETWDEWTARMREKHGNGNGHGRSLSIEAQRLLPTPKASDPDRRSEASARVRVNSRGGHQEVFSALSYGATTPPPSTDGSTSSGDRPPPPPSPDETDDPDCLPFSWNG